MAFLMPKRTCMDWKFNGSSLFLYSSWKGFDLGTKLTSLTVNLNCMQALFKSFENPWEGCKDSGICQNINRQEVSVRFTPGGAELYIANILLYVGARTRGARLLSKINVYDWKCFSVITWQTIQICCTAIYSCFDIQVWERPLSWWK